jgi:hypothetical protein
MVGNRLGSMLLPVAGGADEQDVVPAGRRDFEHALDGFLPFTSQKSSCSFHARSNTAARYTYTGVI